MWQICALNRFSVNAVSMHLSYTSESSRQHWTQQETHFGGYMLNSSYPVSWSIQIKCKFYIKIIINMFQMKIFTATYNFVQRFVRIYTRNMMQCNKISIQYWLVVILASQWIHLQWINHFSHIWLLPDSQMWKIWVYSCKNFCGILLIVLLFCSSSI